MAWDALVHFVLLPFCLPSSKWVSAVRLVVRYGSGGMSLFFLLELFLACPSHLAVANLVSFSFLCLFEQIALKQCSVFVLELRYSEERNWPPYLTMPWLRMVHL